MSAKKPRKTAARNGGPKNGTPEPELIPQPHGGALLSWPKPNHPPGPGRPPSALRAELRTILEGGLDILRDIIAGKVTLRLQRKCEKCGHVPDDKAIPIPVQTAVQDALRAIDLAGKYGIGVVKGVSDNVVREKLQQTIDIIGRELPAEEAERILGLLEPVWR